MTSQKFGNYFTNSTNKWRHERRKPFVYHHHHHQLKLYLHHQLKLYHHHQLKLYLHHQLKLYLHHQLKLYHHHQLKLYHHHQLKRYYHHQLKLCNITQLCCFITKSVLLLWKLPLHTYFTTFSNTPHWEFQAVFEYCCWRLTHAP